MKPGYEHVVQAIAVIEANERAAGLLDGASRLTMIANVDPHSVTKNRLQQMAKQAAAELRRKADLLTCTTTTEKPYVRTL